MKNQPTPQSPKNRFRVEFTFNKPLKEIGSVSSFGLMDISDVENHPQFQHRKRMAKDGAMVVIRENKKTYPEFDWGRIKTFSV